MRTIISGSRSITDYSILLDVINKCPWKKSILSVVCGGAKGVDALGERWGQENHLKIVVIPANWNEFGKKAGYIRNKEMAKVADALIAVWNGESKGTGHMIEVANKKGLAVMIYNTLTGKVTINNGLILKS